MGGVRATEEPLHTGPDESRAIRTITTDHCLVAQPWAGRLADVRLELAPAERVVSLAPAGDVVVLPMTASTAQESLRLVSRIAEVCATPVLLAVGRGCEHTAASALHDGATSFFLLPYRRSAFLQHLQQAAGQGPRARTANVLTAGRVVLDVRRREVTVDGLVAPMPAREFDILRLLLERAGHVVPTPEILARLWPAGEDGSNSLAVHVRRLRERLEADPSRPTLLQTVRGVGYKVQAPPA